MAEILQRINIPIEGPFWRAVLNHLDTQNLLCHPNTLKDPPSKPRILIIGDPMLNMAKEILQTHPLAKLTIVENDLGIVARTRTLVGRCSAWASINIVPGAFPDHPQDEIHDHSFDLVILKNIIHFQPKQDRALFVLEAIKRLNTGGFVFATEPWWRAHSIRRVLAESGINAQQELKLESWNLIARSHLFIFPAAWKG